MADECLDVDSPAPEATSMALQDNHELTAQMLDSSSAYARMTLQVEQAAADLRALVSRRDFKCLAEISAASRRVAAAESELIALRATIGAQSGLWLQHLAAQRCTVCDDLDTGASRGTELLSQLHSATRSLGQAAFMDATGGPTGPEQHRHQLDESLKRLQTDLDCANRDRATLNSHILGQGTEIHSLQQSIATAQQQLTIKDHLKLHELESTAASALVRQAESACSHLREIRQQQIISMREAAEAAQRTARFEQELQEQRKQAAEAFEARDAVEREQRDSKRSLQLAELRAREAEASCSQLCSQIHLLASERRMASPVRHDEHAAPQTTSTAVEVGLPAQNLETHNETGLASAVAARVSDASGISHPAASAAEQCTGSDQVLHAGNDSRKYPELAVPKNEHSCDGHSGEGSTYQGQKSRNQDASCGDKLMIMQSRVQSLQEEANSLHETAKAHAPTDVSAVASLQTSLQTLAKAAKGDCERITLESDVTVDGPIGEVAQAAATCSAALEQAIHVRREHLEALTKAHIMERAALSANTSEVALECTMAVQRAEAANTEKLALAEKLAATEAALEGTEEMVLDLQTRLGHAEEQCQQYKAAASSSSALSDTTQKLLIVAEARAVEAESLIAQYQGKAAQSAKAMLLAHIRADDAEEALAAEDGDQCIQSQVHLATESGPHSTSHAAVSTAAVQASAPPVKSAEPALPNSLDEAQKGLHWAVARVMRYIGTNGTGNTASLPQDAIMAVQELQSHVMHAENFRSLAEDVIIRAKERILAHSKEQNLDIPVMVTERNCVAVEDVASMLDKVLITSSNNSDAVCDLQEALAAAQADADTLRGQAASWKARHETAASVSPTSGELQNMKKMLDNAKQDAAAATAQLLTLKQVHEEHVTASLHAQEDLTQQVKDLQQSLLLCETNADALKGEISILQDQLTHCEEQKKHQVIEDEIKHLHTDLDQAEQREDVLLLQVHTLEQTVQDLSAAIDALQAAGSSEDPTASDPDLKAKLHTVEQHVGELVAQLSEAEASVKTSDAAERDARSRAEELERHLAEARTGIAILESRVDVNMQTPVAGHVSAKHTDAQCSSCRVQEMGTEADVPMDPAQAPEELATSPGARSMHDAQESQHWSQESTYRAHSPTSDWQSESSSWRNEEIRQALDCTKAAESKAAVLQEEKEQQQVIIMQLMDDIGTLQSQLDELQAERLDREDASGSVLDHQQELAQLRVEIKELQNTVESANKDLHLAEKHAKEMEESVQEHERSRQSMMEMLTQKLISLQEAQETLESDFRGMQSERDQALADLQVLAEHCGNILDERGDLEESDGKWLQHQQTTENSTKMAPDPVDQHETGLIKAERH